MLLCPETLSRGSNTAKGQPLSWPSFSAFIRDRTIQDNVFITPVRYLWKAYLAYCLEWGFKPAEPNEFISWLGLVEGVKIKEGGKGRLRRAAEGITLQPVEHEMMGTCDRR